MAVKLAPPRLPLLERLGRHGHGRALDVAGLRDSVGSELLRILNTRSSPCSGPSRGPELSIVDYGVPDWSGSYAADLEDRTRLARNLERAVRAFEPRLREPRVEVDLHPEGMRQLLVRLSGTLWVSGAADAVSYGLGLDGNGAALIGMATKA